MTMTLAATFERGSGAPFLWVFDNIPQTGKDLLILFSTRRSSAFEGIKFNNSSGVNYIWRELRGTGAAADSTNYSQTSFFQPTYFNNPSSATASTFSNGSIYISNYASTSAKKSVSFDIVTENNGTTAYQYLAAGLWDSTNAVTRIENDNTVDQYSTVSLYIIS